MTSRLHEVHRIKDSTQRELAELAAQLKIAEETRDAMRRDILVAKRRMQEGNFV